METRKTLQDLTVQDVETIAQEHAEQYEPRFKKVARHAFLLALGATVVITRLIGDFVRFYERMNRYEALMDEANELEKKEED